VSITTKRGDGGETSLVGGIRVSKGDPRRTRIRQKYLYERRGIFLDARHSENSLSHRLGHGHRNGEPKGSCAAHCRGCGLADGLGSRHRRQRRHSVRLLAARAHTEAAAFNVAPIVKTSVAAQRSSRQFRWGSVFPLSCDRGPLVPPAMSEGTKSPHRGTDVDR
jgi:hypothetical protein